MAIVTSDQDRIFEEDFQKQTTFVQKKKSKTAGFAMRLKRTTAHQKPILRAKNESSNFAHYIMKCFLNSRNVGKDLQTTVKGKSGKWELTAQDYKAVTGLF